MQSRLNRKYTYRVVWSSKRNRHITTCAEFPEMEKESATVTGGISRLRREIQVKVEEMFNSGQEPPEPLGDKEYSGKFVLRITPEMHRELAIEAAESGVSLNYHLASILMKRS